jgi:multicomponent Na+:H+ antiporter subunit G
MTQMLIDIASWFFLTLGGLFVLIGGIGALRMPTLYSRMHAASLTDTMAAVFILFGIMLQAGWTLATVKLIAILVFLLFTSPTSSNALASAAILAGHEPQEGDVKPPEPVK